MWLVQNQDKATQLEMVIMDAKGDKIQVLVKKEELATWSTKLRENTTYVMHNFKVMCNKGQYKVCDHKYKLSFTGGTTLKEHNLPEIPLNVFKSKSFVEMISGNYPRDMLIGMYPVSLSNSWHGSKLLINEVVPEITTFKERYDAIEIHELSSQSQGLTQMSGCFSQFSEQDRFMYKAQVKTISEINAQKKDETYVTVATTGKFSEKNGWSYDACNKCNKKVESVDAPFTCKCGKYNEKSIPRYKLEIKVYDKKDNANFIFWDRECAQLIGNSALELRNLMIECGEDDPKLYPEPLDKMLGCTLALRVKVQPNFNSSSVMKMSQDKELITAITQQLETNEATCEIDKAVCNANEVTQYAIQSLSATADHDPDLEVPLTPTKRLSSEMQFEDTLSQDVASAQLSSTKMTKHIKTE